MLERAVHAADAEDARGVHALQRGTQTMQTVTDLGAGIVAKALLEGDAGAMLELSSMLETAGTKDEVRRFILHLVFALLPSTAQEQILRAQANNVIDLFAKDGR